jgi:hypothetical protein
MKVRFATCVRKTALEFLRKFYPSQILEDTGGVAALLDLVEADIIRIPDPEFHPGGQVLPSTNWDESKKDEYTKALIAFQKDTEPEEQEIDE